MNLCFKNLGIMNLCTSARESWIKKLWEKLNKIHVWINCVRSRECRIWLLRVINFQTFSRGTCPWTPLYNSCNWGWQSACFSNNLVLNVQWQNNSMLRQNLNSESWITEAKTTGIMNIKIQMIPLLPPIRENLRDFSHPRDKANCPWQCCVAVVRKVGFGCIHEFSMLWQSEGLILFLYLRKWIHIVDNCQRYFPERK